MMNIDLNATAIDPTDPNFQPLLADLQGSILKSHGREHAAHLFLRFRADGDTVRWWIRQYTEIYVTSAQRHLTYCDFFREDGIGGGLFGNIFLSADGYRYLGFADGQLPEDDSFRKGLKNRRDYLGDPPIEEWEDGFRDEIHAMILLAEDQAPRLEAAVEQVQESLKDVADIVNLEVGANLRNEKGQAIEHFGFVDGISQPLFLERDIEEAQEQGDNKYDPRAPLKLVLKWDPNGDSEASYGSFLVFRKLEQDVQKFRAKEVELAEALGVDPEMAGAYVFGRYRDGTPISMYSQPVGSEKPVNNFDYREDTGARCPVHSHIRKTNPRGSSAAYGYTTVDEERGGRIVRRGIPYGIQDLNPPPGEKVGLLFMCFQSSIAGQYERIQATWANDSSFLKENCGLDPIIGQGTQPGDGQSWPLKWGDDSSFGHFDFSRLVKMRGGEYFFAPSLSFLRNL